MKAVQGIYLFHLFSYFRAVVYSIWQGNQITKNG